MNFFYAFTITEGFLVWSLSLTKKQQPINLSGGGELNQLYYVMTESKWPNLEFCFCVSILQCNIDL